MEPTLRVSCFVLVLAVAAGGLGCKKLARKLSPKAGDGPTTGASASGGAKLSAPPTPQWKDTEVTFAELPKARGYFSISKGAYEITFSSMPPGTMVSVRGQKSTASSSGYVSTKVDISEQLAGLATRDAFDFRFKYDPKIPITLDFGGPTLALDAPAVAPNHGLIDAFKKVADTPLVFGTEKAEASRPEHSIAFMESSTPEVLGPATVLRDVDWVAVTSDLPSRTGRTCKFKATDSAGAEKGYPLRLVDRTLTVYERRTSKAIASKDFKAEDRCPMLAFGGEAKSYPDQTAMKTFLRELRTSSK